MRMSPSIIPPAKLPDKMFTLGDSDHCILEIGIVVLFHFCKKAIVSSNQSRQSSCFCKQLWDCGNFLHCSNVISRPERIQSLRSHTDNQKVDFAELKRRDCSTEWAGSAPPKKDYEPVGMFQLSNSACSFHIGTYGTWELQPMYRINMMNNQ